MSGAKTIFKTRLDVSDAAVRAAATAPAALKTWSSSIVSPVDGQTYDYTIVGNNPTVAGAVSTAITVPFIPLRMVFLNGDGSIATYSDPNAGCFLSSPFWSAEASPLFIPQSWTWGGVNMGVRQYGDAFMRANFWQSAKPKGISPKYGVTLTLKPMPTKTVLVPWGDWRYMWQGGGTCGVSGEAVNDTWFQTTLKSTVIPSYGSQITPAMFPVFLTYEVWSQDPATTNPNLFIGGEHGAFARTSGGPLQTYAFASYNFNDAGQMPSSKDVNTLSHEIGDWLLDPYGDNWVPYWGYVGQVPNGCQGNMEAGDPLTGTDGTWGPGNPMYHLQDLALFSWFYRQSPSVGLNGWYSVLGNFRTAEPAVCVPPPN